MPRFILILQADEHLKPWLAYKWDNDFDKLDQLQSVSITRGRHFDRTWRDKKFPVKSIENAVSGKKIKARIIGLYEESLFRLSPRKAVKKAAKKAAPKKKAAKKAAKKR